MSTIVDKITFSYIYFYLEILFVMNIFNTIVELFVSICCLSLFISLFELYYRSKGYSKNDLNKKSLIRVISFFILFFILFYYIKFYVINNLL